MGTAYTGQRKVYEPPQAVVNDVKASLPVSGAAEEPTTTSIVLDNDLSELRLRKKL